MEIKDILSGFHFLETKIPYDHAEVIFTREYEKGLKKLMKSGCLTKNFKTQLDIATKAFEDGTDMNLGKGFSNHEFSPSTASKGYIRGDLYLPGNIKLIWVRYLTKPVVEFTDIGNHANTRATTSGHYS